ncbi:uncharacterized protein LOC113082117 [Carassius auratus]|uniref:Uncharacterized protein LOC113082117 n=1 Tax=Carassius auratus TaxID=7957 RepID=A0A6P6NMN7_CARAU|nr:uncharacterized protein LOC113082117 [Carassius auratus]
MSLCCYIRSSFTDQDTAPTTALHQTPPEIYKLLKPQMSDKNLQLTKQGQYDNDEGHDTSTEKQQKGEPSVKATSGHSYIFGTTNINDTYQRPGNAYTEGKFAQAVKYVEGHKDEEGTIPKTGVYAEAGVGRARAEYSVFEAEAKGPNASAGAEASLVGVGAMARAELGSASAKAGPVGLKVGLGVDTGASIGVNGVEVKVLGTGISVGPKTSVSVLGSEVSCSVM